MKDWLSCSRPHYSRIESGWGLFAARAGAVACNCTHSYLAPIGLCAMDVVGQQNQTIAIAIIWIAHIGFDRALGYGLKYSSGFNDTHLGRIGKSRPSAFN